MDAQNYPYTALASGLALAEHFVMTVDVIKARMAKKLTPPQVPEQDEDFQRVHRVHGNTTENLVALLPLLALHTKVVKNDKLSGSLGLAWVVGRCVYRYGYLNKKENVRVGGFVSSLTVQAVLLAGVLYGASCLAWNKLQGKTAACTNCRK